MKNLTYLLIPMLIIAGILYACSVNDDDACLKKAYKNAVVSNKTTQTVNNMLNVTLTEDTTYNEDTVIDGNLNLNGFNLTVIGDLTILNNLQGGGTISANNVIVYNNVNSGTYEMTIIGECFSVGGNLNSPIEINGGNFHITGNSPGSGSVTGTSIEDESCSFNTLGVEDTVTGEEVVISCDKEWGVNYNGYSYTPRQ